MRHYIIECIGTFFIVLAVSLTENPIAIGLIYLSMLYFGARVSGAHYNPAITQALWLRGKFPTENIVWYVIAQCIGAAAAIIFEYHLSGSLFVPDVSPEDNLLFLCLLETLFTFVLCYLYLVTRTVRAFKDTQLYGIILGFSLIGLSSMGGIFNPAIGCASLALNAFFAGAMIHVGNNLFLYVACPLIGSALAGFMFDYFEAPASGQFVSVDSF